MLSNVSYLAMKALAMEAGDERKWVEMLERVEQESSDRDIIIRDDIKNCTVEKVTAETIRHKPGLVVVDYLEEMRSRKGLTDWESVRENARGLKQQARVTRIPHVTGTQINRDGDTAHQSIHKIADAIIQMYPDEDDEKVMMYRLLKYRDGRSRVEAMMEWDLDRMVIQQTGHRRQYEPLGTMQSNAGTATGRPNPWSPKVRKPNPGAGHLSRRFWRHEFSNFCIEPDGSFVEREFQAAKYEGHPIRQAIVRRAATPRRAKKLGRLWRLTDDELIAWN